MKERGGREDRRSATWRAATELRAWQRRVFRRGVLASVVLHLAILLLALLADVEPPSPFAAAGPRASDDRAAAGGGMEAVQLRALPPPPEIPAPPEPVPVPDLALEVEPEPEPEPEPETIDFAGLADALAGEATGDPGPEEGPGTESGTGEGDGGTEEEGRFRVVPPSPRGLILPPADRPGRVRGREVTVWVYITEEGRVVPDSTRIRPSTGDRRFDDRLRRQAAEWIFEPARRQGQPVAEWFQYVVVL